jgi:preprotein translocase subunit YajC
VFSYALPFSIARGLFSTIQSAVAQATAPVAAAPAAASQPSMIENFAPLVIIGVVFYFFLIRPQSKARKEHQAVLGTLKRGDEVLTASGILGSIEGITEKFVTLEIAPSVKIRILRSQIAGIAKDNLKSEAKA